MGCLNRGRVVLSEGSWVLNWPFAVAAMKDNNIVGHVPRKISTVCSLFLHWRGLDLIVCCVTGRRWYILIRFTTKRCCMWFSRVNPSTWTRQKIVIAYWRIYYNDQTSDVSKSALAVKPIHLYAAVVKTVEIRPAKTELDACSQVTAEVCIVWVKKGNITLHDEHK